MRGRSLIRAQILRRHSAKRCGLVSRSGLDAIENGYTRIAVHEDNPSLRASYSIFGENFREETEWDTATRGWGTDEASRVFICAAITLVDISILLQVLALPVVCCQHAGRNRPTRAAR